MKQASIFAVYILEMLINYFYFTKVFVETKEKIFFKLGKGLVCFIPAALIYMAYQNPASNVASYFAACALFALWTFKCKPKNAVIHSIILTTLMCVIEFATVYIMSELLKTTTSDFATNNTVYIIDCIISKAVLLITCICISRFSKKEDKVSNKGNYPVLIIFPACVIANLIIIRDMESCLTSNSHEKFIIPISVISFSFMFSIIAIYIFYENNIKKEINLIELRNTLKKKELDEAYFAILENQNTELRILAHDTKNHLSMIKSLSDNKDVHKYIQNILDDIDSYSTIGKTNNKMLDLIINKYTSLCKVSNIIFYTDIQNTNLNYFDNSDLSGLLNNLLDNALEASKISKAKWMEITIKRINGIDMISIVNSSDTSPGGKGRNLITKKDNKLLHGYGTKSIQKIVNKYNGEYEWFYDDSDKTFHTTLVFSNDMLVNDANKEFANSNKNN